VGRRKVRGEEVSGVGLGRWDPRIIIGSFSPASLFSHRFKDAVAKLPLDSDLLDDAPHLCSRGISLTSLSDKLSSESVCHSFSSVICHVELKHHSSQ